MPGSDRSDARAALLEAAARGRQSPPALQVRPPPGASQNGAHAASSGPFRGLLVEELQLCTEEAQAPSAAAAAASEAASSSCAPPPQAWAPLRLAKRPDAPAGERLPAVVLLHATGNDMGSLAAQQAEFARRGYLAVAMDCRYHGERLPPGMECRGSYQEALVRAWRGSGKLPFLLDNVWDLLRLLDYLEQRPDVDSSRIGMTGVSLGGMHTWLAAAADERVAVAAPMIGVQYFGWAVQQGRYQARVDSIPLVFQAAAADLALQQAAAAAARQQSTCGNGGSGGSCPPDGSLAAGGGAAAAGGSKVTPEVVEAVWNVLLPGMLQRYDAPRSLPLLAPRPLLIANGELDPRCPVEGVELALGAVREAYEKLGVGDKLRLFVDRGVGHECTEAMWRQVFAFMDQHLMAGAGSSQAT